MPSTEPVWPNAHTTLRLSTAKLRAKLRLMRRGCGTQPPESLTRGEGAIESVCARHSPALGALLIAVAFRKERKRFRLLLKGECHSG